MWHVLLFYVCFKTDSEIHFLYKQIWLTFTRDVLSSLTCTIVKYIVKTVKITLKDLFLNFPLLTVLSHAGYEPN